MASKAFLTYRPKLWQQLAQNWEHCRDFYSTLYTPELREKYLTQSPMEDPGLYKVRVETAYYQDLFTRPIVDGAALLSDISVDQGDYIPEDFFEDVDLQGNSIEAFFRGLDEEALLLDAVLVLVDYSSEHQRPYWTKIPIDSCHAPQTMMVEHTERIKTLSVANVKEVFVKENDSAEAVTQFDLYERDPARVTTYTMVDGIPVGQEPRTFGRAGFSAGQSLITELPIFWYSVSGARILNTDLRYPNKPPFLWLQTLNRKIFNCESNLEAQEAGGKWLRKGAMRDSHTNKYPPFYVGAGVVEDLPADPNATIDYVEASGTSLAVARESQDKRIATAKEIGRVYWQGGNVAATATQVYFESRQAVLTLSGIGVQKASFSTELFQATAAYYSRGYTIGTPAGGVEVSTRALEAPLQTDEWGRYSEDEEKGRITTEEYLHELQRHGRYPGLDPEGRESTDGSIQPTGQG